jgi:hypothetical protein
MPTAEGQSNGHGQLGVFPEPPVGAPVSPADAAAAYQRTLQPTAAAKSLSAIATLTEAKNYAAAAHKVVKAKVTPALQAANPAAFVQYVAALVSYSKAYDAASKDASVALLKQGDAATDQARRYEASPPAPVPAPTAPAPTAPAPSAPPAPTAPTPTTPAPSSGLPALPPIPTGPSRGEFVPAAPPDVASVIAFCQTSPGDPRCAELCARAKGTSMADLPGVQAVCAAVGGEKSNTIWWIVGGVSAAVIAGVIGVAIYKRRKAAAPALPAPALPAPALPAPRPTRAVSGAWHRRAR